MIVQAAVRVALRNIRNIQVIPVHRHTDANSIVKAFGYNNEKGYRFLELGFVDENGNFYNEQSAYKEAERCGQLSRKVRGIHRNKLYSEDLY